MSQERFQYSSAARARQTSSGSHDRRRAHRYPVTEDRAQLGWWEGAEYRTATAHLINISQTGTLLIAEIKPPLETSVWICLIGPPATEWVEARAVSVKPMRRGWSEVRLIFRGSCPYTVFQPAVYGFESLQEFPKRVGHDPDQPDGW